MIHNNDDFSFQFSYHLCMYIKLCIYYQDLTSFRSKQDEWRVDETLMTKKSSDTRKGGAVSRKLSPDVRSDTSNPKKISLDFLMKPLKKLTHEEEIDTIPEIRTFPRRKVGSVSRPSLSNVFDLPAPGITSDDSVTIAYRKHNCTLERKKSNSFDSLLGNQRFAQSKKEPLAKSPDGQKRFSNLLAPMRKISHSLFGSNTSMPDMLTSDSDEESDAQEQRRASEQGLSSSYDTAQLRSKMSKMKRPVSASAILKRSNRHVIFSHIPGIM